MKLKLKIFPTSISIFFIAPVTILISSIEQILTVSPTSIFKYLAKSSPINIYGIDDLVIFAVSTKSFLTNLSSKLLILEKELILTTLLPEIDFIKHKFSLPKL